MSEFKYTPRTDSEIEEIAKLERESKLLAEGEARFEVLAFLKHISKTGNPTLKAKLKVWDINDKQGFIDDYFPSSNSGYALKKLKSFSVAADIEDIYSAGELNENTDPSGIGGKCILKREMYNSEWKMSVKEYVASKLEKTKLDPMRSETLNASNSKENLNDDIPW